MSSHVLHPTPRRASLPPNRGHIPRVHPSYDAPPTLPRRVAIHRHVAHSASLPRPCTAVSPHSTLLPRPSSAAPHSTLACRGHSVHRAPPPRRH
jgi:hypothetical protein